MDRLIIADLIARACAPDNVGWESFRPGVEIVRLYQHGDGHSAALLRYQPGASVPLHDHPGFEHILILNGTQVDDRGTHGTGTLLVNPPGSAHTVSSPTGCVVLAIWERPVHFH